MGPFPAGSSLGALPSMELPLGPSQQGAPLGPSQQGAPMGRRRSQIAPMLYQERRTVIESDMCVGGGVVGVGYLVSPWGCGGVEGRN